MEGGGTEFRNDWNIYFIHCKKWKRQTIENTGKIRNPLQIKDCGFGAGEGSRTPLFSLGSWCSTDELHLRFRKNAVARWTSRIAADSVDIIIALAKKKCK